MQFEHISTIIFACAIIHTFLAGKFNKIAAKYPEGSMKEDLFHFLGEIEVVFGIWLLPLMGALVYYEGWNGMVQSFNNVTPNMIEPIFVVVIMVMAATRPVLQATRAAIEAIAKIIPLPSESARFFFAVLALTPLLGSFITEPAAMTIAAMQLSQNFYKKNPSNSLKYMTISLLFVNISIGGTLTNFAAPPVIMIANAWEWDFMFMLNHFGWKSAVSILICTTIVVFMYMKEFKRLDDVKVTVFKEETVPVWVMIIHFIFMAWAVLMNHYAVLLLLGFLFFLGWCTISEEFQDKLEIQPAMLVGFFLAGLVIHGTNQAWWIQPLMAELGDVTLFFGSTILTAFNDNAAITFLSRQALPEGFSDIMSVDGLKKFAVVAGAVTGGGLTVIANAPNPAGNSILKGYFGEAGVNPAKLALYSIPPTIVAGACIMLF